MKSKQIPSPNYEFYIKADTSAYKGKWIAIARMKIVAHGKDAEEVYKQAQKKYKGEDISLAKIPEDQILVLKLLKCYFDSFVFRKSAGIGNR